MFNQKNVDIQQVREFWEQFPPGWVEVSHLAQNPLTMLDEMDRLIQLRSPLIHEKYRMHLVKGKKVLDIGCGQGYNAQELARSGAELTAIDLTRKAIDLASIRFKLRTLQGTFVQANAECLPFEDETFDFVCSSGVIHHSPLIEKAVEEIYRVLKNGGEGSIMVYHKSSLRYWWRMQFKYRMLMTLLYVLPAPMKKWVIRLRLSWQQYVPSRWPSTADIVNAGTDLGGVANPLSRVFTRKQAALLFRSFNITGFAISDGAYKPFKENKGRLDRLGAAVQAWTAERWGWYLFIYVRKQGPFA